ncbi:interleukin-5 receptor subunit alpha-like [Xiphophorus maculatus]|uniref:interleukin-5 receptor subunit alpha-like n=1 Tax=Xiphophorus maculatus TaxID=8083 RepID=UPI000C6DBA74|nr:interleukin-5 receptor subunit alpha-like [Xiphophorus maculatus]XP_023191949.1 interleukin-5 receptor subunit alpha-like [Xiphophorus maculatus]XP_023191950.1 interleukin-5 receptor subunit alpha-like [Xiphophorus maculatus]
MKLSPALPVLWYSFLLLLRVSQSEYEYYDADVDIPSTNATGCEEIEEETEEASVVCTVSRANKLNCSWSLRALETGAQLSVSVRLFENERLVDSRNQSSANGVGFISWTIDGGQEKSVVVDFDVILRGARTCYTAVFDEDILNILNPPANLNASIQDGNLHVNWDVPTSKIFPHCFDYQLDIGDQEKPRIFSAKLQYVVPNAAAPAYRVRMRAKVSPTCYGCPHWSEWSPTVTMERPTYRLDPLVIALISLGIPMILLAVLLILRHQRLVKVLFPPIPRPPAKYKHFLEKTDPLNFFHPVPTTKPEEEITEVEDAEQPPATAH